MFIHAYKFAVTKGIIFKNNMKIPHNKNAKLLKTDITKGSYHIFGSYYKCDM